VAEDIDIEVEDGEEDVAANGEDTEADVLDEDGEEKAEGGEAEEELSEEEAEEVVNAEAWSDTDTKEVENGSGAGESIEESEESEEEEDGESREPAILTPGGASEEESTDGDSQEECQEDKATGILEDTEMS